MRLSYQIPLLTALTVIATIFVNIVAFQFFVNQWFPTYTKEVIAIEQENALSPEKLSTIMDVGKLPDKTQNEYNEVISELSTITTSLQNISENPELYIAGSGQAITSTDGAFLLDVGTVDDTLTDSSVTPFAKIASFMAHPRYFDHNTPEGRFILKIISRMLVVNLIFLTLLMLVYFLWINRIFHPINLIIDRLKTYIDTARFAPIEYQRNNEFAPLVSTINNLYYSLKMQDRIRSNFLSDISHEIRTPITAVKCYIEAIEDGVMDMDINTLALLQSEMGRLIRITDRIVEYDHLAHYSTDDIHVSQFGIKGITLPIIHEYAPQLEKKNQRISIDTKKEVFVRMDQDMFTQIVHNIFSNFIKYAGENTTLSCQFVHGKSHIRMMFVDDGIGIDHKEINFIKEKFYRLDKARTQEYDTSMGIGLSIVDHIVRIHDGTFTIEQVTPHGLSIICTFPQ